jgi:predicted nucleic acid-binding protein
MSAACVIDASVAIKWVITEEGTEAANHLRWRVTDFHAPDLLIPETGNILWKKVLRNELTQAEAELACGVLRLAKIEIHEMGHQSLLALQMALTLDHPVYDMTYLALAQALSIPMLTADRRLVNKLSSSKVKDFPEVVLLS